ncbi:hypothetical protein Hanom_Chr12g01085181 [Helianthus anomalus]
MAKIMVEEPSVRQTMEWRTTSNVIDCGIFAMRHMETYMGSMPVGHVVSQKKMPQINYIKNS